MIAWIAQNISTILISAGLIAVIAGIIIGMVSDKKRGRSCCGGACSHCSLSGKCHSGKQ